MCSPSLEPSEGAGTKTTGPATHSPASTLYSGEDHAAEGSSAESVIVTFVSYQASPPSDDSVTGSGVDPAHRHCPRARRCRRCPWNDRRRGGRRIRAAGMRATTTVAPSIQDPSSIRYSIVATPLQESTAASSRATFDLCQASSAPVTIVAGAWRRSSRSRPGGFGRCRRRRSSDRGSCAGRRSSHRRGPERRWSCPRSTRRRRSCTRSWRRSRRGPTADGHGDGEQMHQASSAPFCVVIGAPALMRTCDGLSCLRLPERQVRTHADTRCRRKRRRSRPRGSGAGPHAGRVAGAVRGDHVAVAIAGEVTQSDPERARLRWRSRLWPRTCRRRCRRAHWPCPRCSWR